MSINRIVRWLGIAALAISGGTPLTLPLAHALINPKFTPVHLAKESRTILELRFQPAVKGGKATATVARTLKGTFDNKSIVIDLTASAFPDQAKLLDKTIRAVGNEPALMFIGANPGGGDQPKANKAYVHLQGMWVVLFEDDNGAWAFDEISQQLVATFNGGTDMLLRATDYILKSPKPDMPAKTGATWAAAIPIGQVAGKVSAAMPVDLKGDGTLSLFVASDAGDRLFTIKGKSAQDITAKHKLSTRSLAFAWADFNGDGRLDLASWDGKSLTLWLQAEDGTFVASPAGNVEQCIGLSAIDVGTPGKPALLISTNAAPMLLVPQTGAQPTPLAGGDWPGRELGPARACLVADFHGDGRIDILQPLATGSLLYRGEKPGRFAAPVPCAIAMSEGRASACIGDWDADGQLDVFIAGEDGCRLWHNQGGGRFVESLKLSGEIGYVSKAGAVAACNGDLNNDGRQDIVVLYSGMAPQVFFNRGFRSFGFSQSLDLEHGELLRQVSKGQQAGCLADFTGDGAGPGAGPERWVMLACRAHAERLRSVRPRNYLKQMRFLRAGDSSGGAGRPATGCMERVGRQRGAFIARPDTGPVTITWRFPGRAPQSRKVTLDNKPVFITLDP